MYSPNGRKIVMNGKKFSSTFLVGSDTMYIRATMKQMSLLWLMVLFVCFDFAVNYDRGLLDNWFKIHTLTYCISNSIVGVTVAKKCFNLTFEQGRSQTLGETLPCTAKDCAVVDVGGVSHPAACRGSQEVRPPVIFFKLDAKSCILCTPV